MSTLINSSIDIQLNSYIMKISTVSIYGFFSILFLSFLLSACGNKAQEKTSKTDEKIKTQTNDVKIPILLDLNKTFPEREVNYQDIAEVEYVPLETKDNVLIGQNNRILITITLLSVAIVGFMNSFSLIKKVIS